MLASEWGIESAMRIKDYSVEILVWGDHSNGVRDIVHDRFNERERVKRPAGINIFSEYDSAEMSEDFSVRDFDLTVAFVTVGGNSHVINLNHRAEFFNYVGGVY